MRYANHDLARIRSALFFLSADMPRDDWVEIAMAVKAELGEGGFDLFDEWSRQSDRYIAQDARDTWKSCKSNGGISGATLFFRAKAVGWRDDGTYQKPTPEELAERRRQAAERAAREEVERAREHAQARQNAEWILECSHSASADHRYLLRKGVPPVPPLFEITATRASEILGYSPRCGDEPLTGRLLVVPIYVGGELSTLELIDEAGRKSALRGGAKAGGYWSGQDLADGDGTGITLLIGEGVATVLSAREATGYYVVAALSSRNLLTVAKAMRERYPRAELVILADLVKATGEQDPHAIEAARAVRGFIAVPRFGEDRPEVMTDFNDMHRHLGLEAVAECIANAEAPAGDAGSKDGSESTKDEKADAALIEDAIAKLATDIGAVFEPEVIAALKSVRAASPANYQRQVAALLAAMKRHSRPVKPAALGVIGKAAIAARFAALGCEMESFKYNKATGETDETETKHDRPWVIETAFAWCPEQGESRTLITGVNWSPGILNPFRQLGSYGQSLDGILAQQRAGRDEPVMLLLHLACPRPSYSDRGKSSVVLAE